MAAAPGSAEPKQVGRYLLMGQIASGGMASVHYGRLSGSEGFSRYVAIKRMLPEMARNPEARAMLIDEARIASHVQHVNVVQTLDVVADGDELLLVLEYVHGESLDRLLRASRARNERVPFGVAAAVITGALRGLHAAHEAVGSDGPLELVHRDLSPSNIIIDTSGVPRVLDFGVAKARGRLQQTTSGQLKGKLSYMAPEQVHGTTSRRSDLFSMGLVLWEVLTGQRLFHGSSEAETLSKVMLCQVPELSSVVPDVPTVLAEVVRRALAREPADRFATALEMAESLDRLDGVATQSGVAQWLLALAPETLATRERRLKELEASGPGPGRGPRSTTRLVLAVGVALCVPLAIAAYLVTAGARHETPAMAPVVPAEPAPVSAAAPREPEPVTTPTPEAPAAEPEKSPATEPAPPRHAERHLPSPKKNAARALAKRCDPPYEFDAQGHKRYKAECF